jgi:hypothetical protein
MLGHGESVSSPINQTSSSVFFLNGRRIGFLVFSFEWRERQLVSCVSWGPGPHVDSITEELVLVMSLLE